MRRSQGVRPFFVSFVRHGALQNADVSYFPTLALSTAPPVNVRGMKSRSSSTHVTLVFSLPTHRSRAQCQALRRLRTHHVATCSWNEMFQRFWVHWDSSTAASANPPASDGGVPLHPPSQMHPLSSQVRWGRGGATARMKSVLFCPVLQRSKSLYRILDKPCSRRRVNPSLARGGSVWS